MTPFKIMIIEHDDAVRDKMAAAVLEKGFTVEEVARAHEAGKAADSFFPELFIIDIVMPRIDGKILIRKFKTDEDFERVPIIAIAPSVDKRIILELRQMGITDILLRSMDTDKLIECVEKHYRVKVIAEMSKVE